MDLKSKQLEIIQKSNPMTDDIHTGIRSVEDILSFHESVVEFQSIINDFGRCTYPDYTLEDAIKAEQEGEITVYSSHPIAPGVFVSPSKICAMDYSGGNELFFLKVKVEDVAWIDDSQGQMAPSSDEKDS